MRLSTGYACLAFVLSASLAQARDIPTQYSQEHPLTYPPQSQMETPSGAAESGEAAPMADGGMGMDWAPPVDDVVQTQGNVRYMTGGIGDEEMAAFKAHAHEFSVKVLTTAANGEYIGSYTLRVTDNKGTQFFEAPGDGPLFYLSLPAGTYTLEETHHDITQKQRVTVGKSQKQTRFIWKQ